jgi:hypothetical protein
MTTVAHRTHAVGSAEATKVAHRTHAVSAEAGSRGRAVSDTSCSRHLGSVTSANVRRALAMDRRGALTVGRGAPAMNRLSILRVRCCLA